MIVLHVNGNIKEVMIINSYPDGVEPQWSDTSAFPELVVVVGNTTWEVMQAKKALTVEWETVTQSENSLEHKKKLTDLLSKAPEEASRKDGDPDAAFKKAAKVIEQTYSAPFLAHNTMEPMNFFANVTAEKAELVGPIQTPEFLSKSVSKSARNARR